MPHPLPTPLHEYLVRIEGLDLSYSKKGDSGFKNPARTHNPTDFLVDRGTVVDYPALHPHPESIGKELIFNYIEADSSKHGNTTQVEGHILIAPENVLSIGGQMQGEYVSCAPILLDAESEMYAPSYERFTLDSLEQPNLYRRNVHMGCGIVDRPNQHFPVGTKVWWGEEALADKRWESGFLVRAQYIQFYGEKADQFFYIKQ